MTTFIIRRLLQAIPVLIGVTILVFSLMHLTPGNPAVIMAGESAPQATVQAIEERLGLNDPLHIQYFNFLGNSNGIPQNNFKDVVLGPPIPI